MCFYIYLILKFRVLLNKVYKFACLNIQTIFLKIIIITKRIGHLSYIQESFFLL